MSPFRLFSGAAAVLGFLGLGFFVYLGHSSQNGSAPGLASGSLSACPDTPNCVSSEAGTPQEKRVDMFALGDWDKLPAALEEMGAAITKQDDTYIAAEFMSPTFRFVDDLELRKADDGVHVRSASRVGHSDGGINAGRVKELRENLAK